MNSKTLTALNESIEHWTRLSTGKTKDNESVGMRDCSLCQVFYDNEKGCGRCPVAVRTKEQHCLGSPYEEARNAFIEYGKDSEKFKKAAAKELKFLKSLLVEKPEKAKKNETSKSKK